MTFNKFCVTILPVFLLLVSVWCQEVVEENVDGVDGVEDVEGVNVTLTDIGNIMGSVTKTTWTQRTIYQFLGVPYARAPGKKRRFRGPQPLRRPQPNTTVDIDAREYGPPCPQLKWIQNSKGNEVEGDLEDCLSISIYTKDVNGSCPVLFFIHGGDFVEGGSYQYPPNYLLEKDIVLVVPQYRLGPLGFISTDTKKIPGDAALLDLIAALNFVQNNITSFGGDPQSVTICGHNSGAAIVSAFLFSPRIPSGLFHRAIIQSGSWFAEKDFDLNPVRNARDIAQYRCKPKETKNVEEINKCIKDMNLTRLLECANSHAWQSKMARGLGEYGGSKLSFNSLIQGTPDEIMSQESAYRDIPVMAGVVKNEGTYIIGMVIDWLRQNFGIQYKRLNLYYLMDAIVEFLGIQDSSGSLAIFSSMNLFSKEQLERGDYYDMMNGLIDNTKGCPVLFFIHGGDFVEGGSYQYPPNYLLEKDIVLVVPQYRLGPLGFLSTDSKKVPGNAAMLDLMAALNFTQFYIRRFGGDPKSVTIVGHDSGAAIASAFLFSPQVPRHYFHRVIIQSGSWFAEKDFDLNPVRNARSIAQYICLRKQTKKVGDINKCLKKMPLEYLLEAAHRQAYKSIKTRGLGEYGGSKLTFNSIIRGTPDEIVRRENVFRNIPVMAGVVKNEGTYIFGMVLKWLDDFYGIPYQKLNMYYLLDAIVEFLGVHDSSSSMSTFASMVLFTKKQLTNGLFNEMMHGLIDLCGDIAVKMPVFKIVKLQAARFPNKTYLYTFDYEGSFPYLKDRSIYGHLSGVHHYADLIHLFPHPDFGSPTKEDMIISKRMVDLWGSFVQTGVPKAYNVHWPPVTKITGPYLHINKKCTIGECFTDEYSVTTREKTVKNMTEVHEDLVYAGKTSSGGIIKYLKFMGFE